MIDHEHKPGNGRSGIPDSLPNNTRRRGWDKNVPIRLGPSWTLVMFSSVLAMVIALLVVALVDGEWKQVTPLGKWWGMFCRRIVVVYSCPTQATIRVNGKLQREKTPARLRMGEGQCDIELRLDGYPPMVRRVFVNAHRPVATCTFAFEVPFHVTTRPVGAEVMWGGTCIGTTPLDARVEVESAPVSIELRHSSFAGRRLSGSLNLCTGMSTGGTFLDIQRDTTSGLITWLVSGTFYTTCSLSVSPRDGQIAVDGTTLQLSDGAATCSLDYGEHHVTAGRPGFLSQPATINVTNGQELARTFRLEHR